MASFHPYEFQGRGLCDCCHATAREEFRVQDTKGYRIGKRVIRYACACYPLDRRGQVLSDEETLGDHPSGPKQPIS